MAAVKPRPGKSPTVAVLASLLLYFLPGAGQFYAGTFSRGLCFLLGTYAVVLGLAYVQLFLLPQAPRWVMIPFGLAWWAFMAYDAYRCALASPPDLEDVAQAVSEQAGEGLVPLPSFDAASPALRRTWAFTRWAMLGSGALIALLFLAPNLVAVAAAFKSGSYFPVAWGLFIAGLAGGFIHWLGRRALLVHAAMSGPVPLPADKLRSEVWSFVYSAAAVAAVVVFGAFITQGVWRDLVRRSNEGATRGNLASLRDAVGRAREAEMGLAPATLEELRPRFIASIPPAKLSASSFRSFHKESNAVLVGGAPDDSGGWLYDAAAGAVYVNCTHTDFKGQRWNTY